MHFQYAVLQALQLANIGLPVDSKGRKGDARHYLQALAPVVIIVRILELPDDFQMRALAFSTSDLSVNFSKIGSIDKLNFILILGDTWVNNLICNVFDVRKDALD